LHWLFQLRLGRPSAVQVYNHTPICCAEIRSTALVLKHRPAVVRSSLKRCQFRLLSREQPVQRECVIAVQPFLNRHDLRKSVSFRVVMNGLGFVDVARRGKQFLAAFDL
jgi:hypothetical protein